jgi:hypothetical protein
MNDFRRNAAGARCRVKRWRLTDEQALQLADECAMTQMTGSPTTIYESMRNGTAYIFGALIEVKR